jgi:hypothetical protein
MTAKGFRAAVAATAASFLAGCGTTGPQSAKQCGVYTTLSVPGHHLDMPGEQYRSCKVFGPGQTPTAVVVGYGHWNGTINHPQPFRLQVVERAGGAVLSDSQGIEYADRAWLLNLPIRKSGDYQLKLLIDDAVYDTWDFTVARDAAAVSAGAADKKPAYAEGFFGLRFEPTPESADFTDYDASLSHALLRAVQKEASAVDHDIFVQVEPGAVRIRFDLDDQGRVTSPSILENTLPEALGQFFMRALQAGSPYPSWPAAARTAAGKTTRQLTATFSYD